MTFSAVLGKPNLQLHFFSRFWQGPESIAYFSSFEDGLNILNYFNKELAILGIDISNI